MKARKRYPTDVTDSQWKRIGPLIPSAKSGGRPRRTDMREVVNAMFYITRTGCAWRMLPHEFPPWRTVYEFFKTWRDDGTFEQMNARLREAVRVKAERPKEPKFAIIDSRALRRRIMRAAVDTTRTALQLQNLTISEKINGRKTGPSDFFLGLLEFSPKENIDTRHRTLPAPPGAVVALVGFQRSGGC